MDITPNNKYDIIILLIANHTALYDKFIQIWNKYESTFPSIKVFYVYGEVGEVDEVDEVGEVGEVREVEGNSQQHSLSTRAAKRAKRAKREGNNIIVNCHESLIPGILIKTIKALEFIETNYSYDYLLRSNLSSFFRFDRLLQHVKALNNRNKVYQGFQGYHEYLSNENSNIPSMGFLPRSNVEKSAGELKILPITVPFISGAGILMSKDVVQLLIEKQSSLNYSLIDDVAIGDFMQKFGIILQNTGKNCRYDFINETRSNMSEDKIRLISPNIFHFRIKNRKKRDLDVIVMEKLYRVFYTSA